MATTQEHDPFPLLMLPDLVLQQILTHLTPKERKATRASCKRMCRVASAAVHYFHIGTVREDFYQDYLELHEKFPNIQVVSVADELVASDRPFAALATLSLSKLKNLCCLVLLNQNLGLSAAGMAALTQCKHIKQLVLAAPFVPKGPLMTSNTQAMTAMIAQLPCLTHLLLLPSQHIDLASTAAGQAEGPAAAAAAAVAAAGGGMAAGQQGQRPRVWQLTSASLRSLDCLHGLVQLEVGCDPVGLIDLSSLTPLSNLKHLALRSLGTEAGEQLSVLLALPALRSLSLADASINPEALAHVGRITKLTRLELQGCRRLREQCLPHLSGLHQLAAFRCSMQLSESGLSLLQSIAGCKLRLLEADCIELQPLEPPHTGAHHHQGTAAAAGAVGASGAVVAAAAGAVGGGLLLGGSGGSAHFGPQLLALQVLQLRRVSSSCPQLWQFAPSLTSLAVWGEASNTGLTRALSGHCRLRHLYLCCEHTSDAGLAALSGLSHLQHLTLSAGVAISPQRLVGVVQRLPCLQSLQLSHMKHMSDDGLAALVAVATQLRLLGLQEPCRVTDQGFALLAGLPHLHTLWVNCCTVSPAVLMSVACSTPLALLEVHRSHPEAPGLGAQQLQLLGRVKGPRLEVVLRVGPRPREELMWPRGGGGSSCLLSSPGGSSGVVSVGEGLRGWGHQQGGFEGFEGLSGPHGSTEVLLEPGELRLLVGAAACLGGQLAGVEWTPDFLPDLGGLHV